MFRIYVQHTCIWHDRSPDILKTRSFIRQPQYWVTSFKKTTLEHCWNTGTDGSATQVRSWHMSRLQNALLYVYFTCNVSFRSDGKWNVYNLDLNDCMTVDTGSAMFPARRGRHCDTAYMTLTVSHTRRLQFTTTHVGSQVNWHVSCQTWDFHRYAPRTVFDRRRHSNRHLLSVTSCWRHHMLLGVHCDAMTCSGPCHSVPLPVRRRRRQR